MNHRSIPQEIRKGEEARGWTPLNATILNAAIAAAAMAGPKLPPFQGD